VLVSNAGISKAATIKDHAVEDFDNLFATNVRSPFFLVQQLLPVLVKLEHHCDLFDRGARRSWEARFGQPLAPCLRLDKGALETLVKNWAAILGPRASA